MQLRRHQLSIQELEGYFDCSTLNLDAEKTGKLLFEIPREIERLTNLTSLSLGGNALIQLPQEFGKLSLKKLSLASNKFVDRPLPKLNLEAPSFDVDPYFQFPIEILNILSLEELDLRQNGFESIPPQLEFLTNLKVLDLSNNYLESLPSMHGFMKLKELHLDCNALNEIPKSWIGKLQSLTKLYLGDNGLTDLPSEIGNLSNLEVLSLLSNRISEIPKEIRNLQNLTLLEVTYNSLNSFPPEFYLLTRLKYLHFSYNLFLEFPDIRLLTNLTSIECRSNRFHILPDFLGNLENLTYLDASENWIFEISPKISRLTLLKDLEIFGRCDNYCVVPEFKNLTRLVKMSIPNCKSNSILADFYYLTMLKKLRIETHDDLRKKEIIEMSKEEKESPNFRYQFHILPEIANLVHLTILDLEGLLLQSIPPEIGLLTNLQILRLCRNQISELPREISHLSRSLFFLFLNENCLTHLPPEFCLLTNLDTLNLGDNHLCAFPREILKLTLLRDLSLSENQISFIPREISYLVRLDSLNIMYNNLTFIPSQLSLLPNLIDIEIAGNNFDFNYYQFDIYLLKKLLSSFHTLEERAIFCILFSRFAIDSMIQSYSIENSIVVDERNFKRILDLLLFYLFREEEHRILSSFVQLYKK